MMPTKQARGIPTVLLSLTFAAACSAPEGRADGSESAGATAKRTHVQARDSLRVPLTLPRITSGPQGTAAPDVEMSAPRDAGLDSGITSAGPLATASLDDSTFPRCDGCEVKAEILVISANGQEPALTAIRQTLDYLGTPYTLWIATQRPGALTSSNLEAGQRGRYSGVILTSGTLGYFSDPADPHSWVPSALTPAEFEALFAYEAKYGVRQITWYTYPTAGFGFGPVTGETSEPVTAYFTESGREIFGRVNTENAVTLGPWGYAYLAPVDPAPLNGATVVPLLVDASNSALMVLTKYSDGRENLAQTFDGNAYLVHSVQLGYDLVNWVTRGVFLGQRRTYLTAQVDDLFLPNAIFQFKSDGTPCNPDLGDCPEYRNSAADIDALLSWQATFNTEPLVSNFRLDWAFNGEGAVIDPKEVESVDALTNRIVEIESSFRFINHTLTHRNLDAVTSTIAAREVQDNNQVATRLKLTNYSRRSVVTPEITGLSNPDAMAGLASVGVRYVVSDTSHPWGDNPSPNAGRYNAFQPSILEIPRHPTNLFYNVSTPEEWENEYNFLYRDYWRDQGKCIRDDGTVWCNYDFILSDQSELMLHWLLRGDIDPIMFHIANVRAYDGTHTLLGDLIGRAYAKYAKLMKMPVVSLSMDDLGISVARRMAYNTAGATGVIGPGKKITLSTVTTASVPVTGVLKRDGEMYAGQPSSWVPVPGGSSVTLTLP
jgi:hypothetical protein